MASRCAVIPCFNEEGSIREVVQAARREVQTVIVVDDGSTDRTSQEAEAAGAEVIRLDANLGKGTALRRGLQCATQRGFAWALTLDGDGQHDAADTPALISHAERTGAALVIGNRMQNAAAMPPLRRFVNRWMTRRLSNRLGVALADSQCGFRLVNLEALARVPLKTGRFQIESELIAAFVHCGCKIEFAPIRVIYKSKPSKIHPVVDAARWLRWFIVECNQAGTTRKSPFSVTSLLIRAVRLAAVTILLGWLYAWASPWAYPDEEHPGFGRGLLHGALMPMALPSLVIGKNVPIYATGGRSKTYKLGYIVGINVCGLAFFGSAFWGPRAKPANHNIQLR